MTPLVLASRNRHKIRELTYFLQPFPISVRSLDDFPSIGELVEDGVTFRENALKKAGAVAAATGMHALADDSGLEVFYLNGRPGVYSARYSGPGATDASNNDLLLSQLRGVPPRRRRAQFIATLAVVGPTMNEIVEGSCPGWIGEEPHGTNGFGYDPIFYPDGYNRTYAQLTQEEKNAISHRARAFEALRKILLTHQW